MRKLGVILLGISGMVTTGCASAPVEPVRFETLDCPVCPKLTPILLAPECYRPAPDAISPYSGPAPTTPVEALAISDKENAELRAQNDDLREHINACAASANIRGE